MKVTMKDIAQRLNISINAVSMALNEKPGLSDQMRLLILKTADEMGYLHQKKKYLSVFSKTNLCIMMQKYYVKTEHFYSIVVSSIIEEAKKMGYAVSIEYFDDQNMLIPECIAERKVAGILVVGKISVQPLKRLKNTHIPIILVDYTALGEMCDCVLTHNKQGGYMITQYVLEQGYRKIGFFGDLNYSISFQDRFTGFKEALLKNGIIRHFYDHEYIEKYSFLKNIENCVLEHRVEKIIQILSEKSLPEVFVCANDMNAYIVIQALEKMGYHVPEDIGVTGFDDIPLSAHLKPPLTTIRVQKEYMGQEAVFRLLDLIQSKNHLPQTELLSVFLVERKSVCSKK